MNNTMINGINVDSLKGIIKTASDHPDQTKVHFQVATHWAGGTRSETRVDAWKIGDKELKKNFNIIIDEPEELLGKNEAPNPQEMLMAAFNACMLVGYVAGCSIRGITLESIKIQTEGMLDLRGFLGLDDTIKPGYDEIEYSVFIKGDGTDKDYQDVHETVMATSPNRWNIANAIKLKSKLVIG